MLAPATISVDNPRFLAFIPGAPTEVSMLFDLVVGASSIYGGSWLEASGAVYAENQALRWLADLAGLSGGAGGCFVPGGTIGNLSALVAARHAAPRGPRRRPAAGWRVALHRRDALVGGDALRAVMDVDVLRIAPDDARGRMTGEALARRSTRPSGRTGCSPWWRRPARPTSASSTTWPASPRSARSAALWMHVDGAYGGAALAAPSVRDLFAGIEHADCFIVDPHKWLFAPFDCCALLYRDPEMARRAHTQQAGYLDTINEAQRAGTRPTTPSTSAGGARGLPFWFSLAVHGTRRLPRGDRADAGRRPRGADEIRARPIRRARWSSRS